MHLYIDNFDTTFTKADRKINNHAFRQPFPRYSKHTQTQRNVSHVTVVLIFTCNYKYLVSCQLTTADNSITSNEIRISFYYIPDRLILKK